MSEKSSVSAEQSQNKAGFQSCEWEISYKTSSTLIEERPLDILKDFYIPALTLAVKYDRVAGYFRSTSLAAASQGFSSFVNKGGKMRLIVGADLQEADVEAVLKGDQERLAAQLNSHLNCAEKWPAEVRNGVQLLAWMVARGFLEVKVAFRLHAKSGKPLPWASYDDGYVHEKWFVMHDIHGKRLYGAGTLNESKTALVLNAENFDLHADWWADIERLRVDNADRDYENLWNNRVAHIPVYPLPEAVRKQLIHLSVNLKQFIEIDGSTATMGQTAVPSNMELLRFALLRDAPNLPGGRYVGMYTAPVEPWPHQEIVARRLIETWPYNYLLCDEVGLGKTIEAGLAFRSLILSGLVRRILVAAPASLTEQWQRQLASKLLLSFGRFIPGPTEKHSYIYPDSADCKGLSVYEPDFMIVSTGILTREERKKNLEAAKQFDIVLLDEAHSARRQNPTKGTRDNADFGQLYRVVRDHLLKKAEALWLATATPMQIDPVEAFDLIALTKRVGAFQNDPTLALSYYELLSKIINRAELNEDDWNFLRLSINAMWAQDPLLWDFISHNVIDKRISSVVDRWLKHGYPPRGRDRVLIAKLVFSASPLSRVMLRHNRRLLEIYKQKGKLTDNLPQREILAMPEVRFNDLEKEIYDLLEEYCQGLSEQINQHSSKQNKFAVGFLLNFLRLRFSSSLYALHETLKRRYAKVDATLQAQLVEDEAELEEVERRLEDFIYDNEIEDDHMAVKSLLKDRTKADLRWEKEKLRNLIGALSSYEGNSSKMTELLKALDKRLITQSGRLRQTVIFSRFFDTVTDLVRRIRQVKPDLLLGTYSGKGGTYYDLTSKTMREAPRENVKEMFLRGEIDLLVCTDAAAEGLNLQTADLLVNYDLGWNPMKLEQRVGRIDRIGQKHKVVAVLNLCYLGSVEEIVYNRLLKRLEEANLIVGTQQFSLLPVTPEDFQNLAEGRLSAEELYRDAKTRMQEQLRRAESMEMSPRDLYDIYMRLAASRERINSPVQLCDIWQILSESEYLRSLGCKVKETVEGDPYLEMWGVEGVSPGARITTSRKMFEEGTADSSNVIRFASFGEPVFDAILEHFKTFELPPSIKRIMVDVHGIEDAQMVGYVVAGDDPGQNTSVFKFVKDVRDLDNLVIAKDETVDSEALKSFRDELEKQARAEFDHYQASDRIERANARSADAHELLTLMTGHSIIEGKARFSGEGARFWQIIAEIENQFKERDRVQVPIEPASFLEPVKTELLFNVIFSGGSDMAYVEATKILGQSTVEKAMRNAESMKEKRSELTANAVLARLNREIKTKHKMIT